MPQRPIVVLAVTVLAVALALAAAYAQTQTNEKGQMGEKSKMEQKAMSSEKPDMMMPFGGPKDVAFAKALWPAIDGYRDWAIRSDLHPGMSPHGSFMRIYYNVVNIDGRPYHVLVKDNFGGEGVTMQMVEASPSEYLLAITPMVQREPGYDPEDNDWFYVKYNPDGSIATADKDMALAGRVAKGMPAGCIPCHAKAGGGDFLFSND
ncbi:MAG: hypothetical protein JXA57_08300 [Armatimonadetes bacterium]|nr:hypothetical protein [Armatimonadota bacterium]